MADPVKREENPFSFKHFLKRGTNEVGTSNNSSLLTNPQHEGNGKKITGAKPKVLLCNNADNAKMKRSPKFSSFDSQASLTEFAGTSDNMSMSNVYQSANSPIISTSGRGIGHTTPKDMHSHRSFFQRSYSHYELDNSYLTEQSFKESDRSMEHRSRFPTTTNTSSLNKIVSPDTTSALPDFVQDHIILEQWYSGGNGNQISNSSLEYDHLPDFTITNKKDTNSRYTFLIRFFVC